MAGTKTAKALDRQIRKEIRLDSLLQHTTHIYITGVTRGSFCTQ